MAHRIEEHDMQEGLVQAWHGKTLITPDLSLENNWLTRWDLVPVVLEKRGEPTRWNVLECSDLPGVEIGQPYNPETFQPIDNKAFLEMIRSSISGTSHKVVSVGSVRNRGRVFVSIELNGMEKFKAAKREFSAFLNFGNGHDKSSVLWINTSNICTVCDNTFSFNLVAVEGKNSSRSDDINISQRHTKNVKLKLPGIADVIDRAIGVQAEFKLELDQLNDVEISRPEARNLFAGFIGRNIEDRKEGLSKRAFNIVGELESLFVSGRGNHGRSLADSFQAVTDYYTHTSAGGWDRPFRQMQSSEYGAGLQAKREFWREVRDEDKIQSLRQNGIELLTNTK
jgi:hypothetical protein